MGLTAMIRCTDQPEKHTDLLHFTHNRPLSACSSTVPLPRTILHLLAVPVMFHQPPQIFRTLSFASLSVLKSWLTYFEMMPAIS